MTFITISVLVLLFLLWKTAIVVPMREAYVIERLGKFKGVLSPGFHILIPFIDRVAYKHEMREQVFDVPGQTCITRDNMQVVVDGIIYLKVMDPERASYGIEDYETASINLAQTTMRSEIGKLALNEAFSERDKLNDAIVREVDKASDPWGIKVLRYELKNITPSAQVIHTLEKQMEAERERRSEVTLATAEKEAMIHRSQGQRQEAINLSEGEKTKRINEAEGKASEIGIVADATAEGLGLVADALSRPGGSAAMEMRVVEQYIRELGQVAENAKVSVVPSRVAEVQSVVAGLGQVSEKMRPSLGVGELAARGRGASEAQGRTR
jgi:regulator of protease activity HflC (stomatin/prohibitin superfamily)